MPIEIQCDICEKSSKGSIIKAGTNDVDLLKCEPLIINASELMQPKAIEKHGWKFNKKDTFVGKICMEIYDLVAEALDGEITAPAIIRNEIDHSKRKPSVEVIGEAAKDFEMAFPCRYCEYGIKTNIIRHEKRIHPDEYIARLRTEGARKQTQMHKSKILSRQNRVQGIGKKIERK